MILDIVSLKKVEFPNFDCPLEFWWKSQMLFISKTKDKVISNKFWNRWVLETLDIVHLENV